LQYYLNDRFASLARLFDNFKSHPGVIEKALSAITHISST
jgi:hypothetical protein